MGHTATSLLYHVVFATKNREPFLTSDLTAKLFPYVGGIARELGAVAIRINGPADHVHLLLSIPANRCLADVLRVVKTNSSRWVHEAGRNYFAWQEGYSAFTVSNSQAGKVKEYIANQLEHHRRIPFHQEHIVLLEKHGIAPQTAEIESGRLTA